MARTANKTTDTAEQVTYAEVAIAEIADTVTKPKGRTRKKAETDSEKKTTKSTSRKTAPKTPKAPAAKAVKTEMREQTDNDIFALDIGTRTVVGVLGYMDKDENMYHVVSTVTVPHTQRAMIDGQIEDIKEVARIVGLVKNELEQKNNIKLTKVAIAAAGRALKTRRASLEFDVSEKEAMTEETVHSFEVDTVLAAQAVLDEEVKNEALIFYCVGHTVIEYVLDDYKIKTLVGHRGKTAMVDLIAAFLPNVVVESLYSVMDLSGLEVTSLTLEPIAAMNVIIPPEVRLINVALVDIGAGTSDIAISQNGSIVAYAMSTLAGDEITEEIIRTYLVDFQTAEEIKQCVKGETFTFTDILGFEHEVNTKEFFESIYSALGNLADNIAENIIKANGKAPAAVFLVGGGSLIPDIAKVVAEKLGLPEGRVAVGGRQTIKHIDFGDTNAVGPEFVTPIGIGVTATMNKGYDFSVVMLNGKKMRIFDTRTVSLVDLLVLAGYKTTQIIGRSGRSLTFTLNGEKQNMKGEIATPAEIKLNGNATPIDTFVKQGDVIEFVPAVSGINASVKISDIAGDVSEHLVMVDDVKYNFGVVARVNDKLVNGEYQIQNFDNVTISEIDTLGDLMLILPFDTDAVSFYVGGKVVGIDYYLKDGDDIFVGEKVSEKSAKANSLAKSIADREAAAKRAEEDARFNSDNNTAPIDEQLQAELREFMEANPDYVIPSDVADILNEPVIAKSEVKSETVNEPEQEEIVSDDEKPPFTIKDDVVYFDTPELDKAIADVNFKRSEQPKPAEVKLVQKAEEVPVNNANDSGEFYVTLNGKRCVLEPNPDSSQHEFIELMSIADIDLDSPSPSGNMVLLLNGEDASFMSPIKKGDTAVIKWAED